MHSFEGYHRFENPITTDESNSDDPKDAQKSPNMSMVSRPMVIADGRTDINFKQVLPEDDAKRREKRLRAWRFLRISAATILLLACSMMIFEAFLDVIIAQDQDADHFGVCGLATGVWVGAVGVVAGILGVCSFRTVDLRRSLMLAHFILLIAAIVGDCVLVVITAFCIDALPYVRYSHHKDEEHEHHALSGEIPIDQMLYAIGAFLLLVAFMHSKYSRFAIFIDI